MDRVKPKFERECHLPRSSVPPVGDTFAFTPCASVIGQRATGAAGGGLRMRAHGLARGKCTFSALSNGTGRPVTGPRSPSSLAPSHHAVMRVAAIDGKPTAYARYLSLPRDERKLRNIASARPRVNPQLPVIRPSPSLALRQFSQNDKFPLSLPSSNNYQ